MNTEKESPLSSFRDRVASSRAWRVATLAFLALVLLIPLSMIDELLSERTNRKWEAVSEIGRQWGGSQSISGPFLRVPTTRLEEREEQVIANGELVTRIRKVEHKGFFILLPEVFGMKARLEPEIRYRGIFRAPVYSSEVEIAGHWKIDSSESYGIADTNLDWKNAELVFQVYDAKGLSKVACGGVGQGASPRPLHLPGRGEWISIAYPLLGTEKVVPLELSFALQGSSSFRFLPIGRDGSVRIESTWADPSFSGARLPTKREISSVGFVAEWNFGEFGRDFPQQWTEGEGAPEQMLLMGSLSGVELADPVDGYRLTERSLKYGGLFIALGFLVFFLFEILGGIRLHPMHYLLAGVAQAVFFLLVLALSEVVHFDYAYGIAGLAATGLVAFYSASVLGGAGRAVMVAGAKFALYGILLVILREQDYALLAGAALVFVSLSVFMFLTRKLNW